MYVVQSTPHFFLKMISINKLNTNLHSLFKETEELRTARLMLQDELVKCTDLEAERKSIQLCATTQQITANERTIQFLIEAIAELRQGFLLEEEGNNYKRKMEVKELSLDFEEYEDGESNRPRKKRSTSSSSDY